MNRLEKYPRITFTIVLLILIMATLFGVEQMLSVFFSDNSLFKYDDRTVVRALRLREWKPANTKLFTAPEERFNDRLGPVQQQYELRTDEYGFIYPSIIYDKPDFEIVFIGGSTTECLYQRPKFRFPYVAARLLEQKTGLKINGINSGKSGNHTLHSIVNYIGKVAERQPRFVALMHATNDIGILGRHKSYWTGDKAISLIVNERTIVRRNYLERFFEKTFNDLIPYTIRVVRHGIAVGRFQLSEIFKSDEPKQLQTKLSDKKSPRKTLPKVTSEKVIKRREVFRRSFEPALRSFVRLTKAWGSEPILMTQVLQPYADRETKKYEGAFLSEDMLLRGNFDGASFDSFHAYANQIIRYVAQSEGAILIDLMAQRAWSSDDVYDGLHFTETGSRHVAEIIASQLSPVILK